MLLCKVFCSVEAVALQGLGKTLQGRFLSAVHVRSTEAPPTVKHQTKRSVLLRPAGNFFQAVLLSVQSAPGGRCFQLCSRSM